VGKHPSIFAYKLRFAAVLAMPWVPARQRRTLPESPLPCHGKGKEQFLCREFLVFTHGSASPFSSPRERRLFWGSKQVKGFLCARKILVIRTKAISSASVKDLASAGELG
jgi:hypothetical protein